MFSGVLNYLKESSIYVKYSPFIPHVLNFGEGFSIGSSLAVQKRQEDLFRLGRSTYSTIVNQIIQLSSVVNLCEKVLVSKGQKKISDLAKQVCIWGVPIGTAIAVKAHSFLPEKVHSAALFIQNHIGLACQCSAAVSATLLYRDGQRIFGGTLLANIVIGFLDRNGMLSKKMSHWIHRLDQAVDTLSSTFSSNSLAKLFWSFDYLFWGFNKYQELKTTKRLTPQSFVDKKVLEDLLANKGFALVNRDEHMQQEVMISNVPEVDIQKLLDIFKRIDWGKYSDKIDRKLQNDPSYNDTFGMRELTKEKKLDLIKEKLQALIDQVKSGHMDAGQIQSHDRMHDYLKIITDILLKEPQGREVELLLDLAIDGGQYCGTGVFYAIERAVLSLLRCEEELGCVKKIHLLLQDFRSNLFETLYTDYKSAFADDSLALLVEPPKDLHQYNKFIHMFGKGLGIRNEVAENDEGASYSIVDKVIMQWKRRILTEEDFDVQQKFRQEYTVDKIVDYIDKEIGTSHLPRYLLFTWWKEWVEKQEKLNPEEKEILLNELTENQTLCGHSLGLNLYEKPDPIFLKAMLVDMGIFSLYMGNFTLQYPN